MIDRSDVEERVAIRLEDSELAARVSIDDLGGVTLWLGAEEVGYPIRSVRDVDWAITGHALGVMA